MIGSSGEPRRFAVLIDADNAASGAIEEVLLRVAAHGVAQVRRAYGDWTSTRLQCWKTVLNTAAIVPVQQFSYVSGKNATDMALVIDAMDLLHAGTVDGFCLVSSDSDFTRLATRLRESGKRVLGFGEPHTPRSFVAACDEFVCLKQKPPEPPRSPSPPKETDASRGPETESLGAAVAGESADVAESNQATSSSGIRNGVHSGNGAAPNGQENRSAKKSGKASKKRSKSSKGENSKADQFQEYLKSLNSVGYLTDFDEYVASRGDDEDDDDAAHNAFIEAQRERARKLRADDSLMNLLQAAAWSQADDDGWAELGQVAAYVRTHMPEFRAKNHGFSRFIMLVKTTGLFQIEMRASKRSNKRCNPFIRPNEEGPAPLDFSDEAEPPLEAEFDDDELPLDPFTPRDNSDDEVPF